MVWILQDVPLGRNIQTLRISRNLTQEELVSQMQVHGSNMSRSTLANIERGNRNIKASDLRIIKTILDFAYTEFFKD